MKFSPHSRARARRYALQALYQWELSGQDIAGITRQFLDTEDFARADTSYFVELLQGVPRQLDAVDAALVDFTERPIQQIDPVERAILRIAAFELLFRDDVPARVVINEAVALTRKFGAEQGYTFVNGVLDSVARSVRPAEFNDKSGKINSI